MESVLGTWTDTLVADESGKQVADMSWWPKVMVWEGSCYDLGYWTPYAEMWFQTRLDKIRAHEARPKSVTVWRNDLKNARNAKRLRDAVFVASENFVAENSERLFR